MINFIDKLLNRITMYRLMLYFLMVLWAAAFIFGAFHILPYSPVAIVFSTYILLLVCWIANELLAKIFKVQANFESVYITGLILTLIITPVAASNLPGVFFLIWAGVLAMASKYVLAINKKHIFNPAAIGVAITALAFGQYASWWVGGNLALLGFILVGGLLVTRKLQRFDLVLAFIAGALISIIATSGFENPFSTIEKVFVHTTLLFFAFVMITEPATTPPTRWLRVAYGAFVGVLFAPALHIGSVYSTPELALVVGNIFSYAVSPKGKYLVSLKEKKEVGGGIYDFVFATKSVPKFTPGQYMEWTLPDHKSDDRGNRRYFTLASSPTESNLRLGIRFYDNPSSFKKDLLAMNAGGKILGGNLTGDFVMPKDATKKLVFLAGGIGITPFRSMVKYLSDKGERRDIVLLYSNRTADEIAYRDVFDDAERTIGLRAIYVLTNKHYHQSRIDATFIKNEIPDYKERMFYISGTYTMVSTFEKTLHELGVPRVHVKTDFFPGFA